MVATFVDVKLVATIRCFLVLFDFFWGAAKNASDFEFGSSSIGCGYAISRISLNSNHFEIFFFKSRNESTVTSLAFVLNDSLAGKNEYHKYNEYLQGIRKQLKKPRELFVLYRATLIGTLIAQHFYEIVQKKTNSSSNISYRYSVTIHIDSLHNNPNTWYRDEYRRYLIKRGGSPDSDLNFL